MKCDRLLPLCVLAAAGLASATNPAGALVRAVVSNPRSDRGVVRCVLFASEDGFPGDYRKSTGGAVARIEGGKATCEFPAVKPGTYAIAVFHDENANEKLDTRIFGIPKEGVGASNNPKPRMGPPRFFESRFEHGSEETALEIRLQY